MEFDRKAIKRQAKSNFKSAYWALVLIFLACTAVQAIMSGLSNSVSNSIATHYGSRIFSHGYASYTVKTYNPTSSSDLAWFVFFLTIAFSVTLAPVLAAGFTKVFTRAYNGDKLTVKEGFSLLFTPLKSDFLRVWGGLMWQALFTVLWTLCFIIPGFIKSIAYSMTPFILADDDFKDVGAKEALEVSMKMTKGHKWQLFVLVLSFIGWIILGFCTIGILYCFFVVPYLCAAEGGAYLTLKAMYLAESVESTGEKATKKTTEKSTKKSDD